MNGEYFIYSGITDPQMIGRENIISYAKGHLCKKIANNIAFVGQKYIGKTVILKSLAEILRRDKDNYYSVVYIDLRHNVPNSNDTFASIILNALKTELEINKSEYCVLFPHNKEMNLDSLMEIFDLLENENKRILILLDGIDETLKSINITRNLWDNLRSLASKSCAVFVTGSRGRLKDICKLSESKTSDFWNIFIDHKVICCFNDQDMYSVYKILESKGFKTDNGARKEIENWTGRHPLLVSVLCREIIEKYGHLTNLTNDHINTIAGKIYESNNDYIDDIWDDFNFDEKYLLCEINKYNKTEITDVNRKILRGLETKGIISIAGNLATSSTRFISQRAKNDSEKINTIKLNYGNIEAYRKNIKQLLETRLSHIKIANYDLSRNLLDIIEECNIPSKCVKQIRGYEQYILAEIYSKEFPTGKIEKGKEWKDLKENDDLPANPEGQMAYLREMRKAKKLNKCSYYTITLLNNMHEAGNYGQHKENEIIEIENVVPFCFEAIELAERITIELGI